MLSVNPHAGVRILVARKIWFENPIGLARLAFGAPQMMFERVNQFLIPGDRSDTRFLQLAWGTAFGIEGLYRFCESHSGAPSLERKRLAVAEDNRTGYFVHSGTICFCAISRSDWVQKHFTAFIQSVNKIFVYKKAGSREPA